MTEKTEEAEVKDQAPNDRQSCDCEHDGFVEAVNFDWLHISDTDDEPYEVFDHEVTANDIHVEGKTFEPENVAPRYFDAVSICPELQKLLDAREVITAEIKSVLSSQQWTPWPEEALYSGEGQSGEWRVIPLLYTFPAYDIKSSKWVGSNTNLCPQTTALLKNIPNIRTALFSRMGPQTRLSAHQGWADLANHVLRVHLPLIVPSPAKNLCGMWVEGHVQYHKPGQLIMFDDSKWHKAFNATDEDRIVLIFDILRPDSVPKGLAEAGHTDQLDHFIEAFEALSTE